MTSASRFFTDNECPRADAETVELPLGDGLALWSRTTDEVLALNASAVAVWSLCDGTTTVGDIAVTLGVATDATRRAELDVVLANLGKAGFLSGSHASQPSRRPGPRDLNDLTAHTAAVEASLDPTHHLALGVMGHVGALSVPDADARAFLASLNRHLLTGDSVPTLPQFGLRRIASTESYVPLGEGHLAGSSPSLVDASLRIVNLMTMAALRRSEVVALHAAAVVDGDGATVIVGGSGAGKSTLAAAAVIAGIGYLADEVVAIEPRTGEVLPHPRALKLEAPTMEFLHPHLGDPGAVFSAERSLTGAGLMCPMTRVEDASPLRRVVFVRYRPGASAELTSIDVGEALGVALEQRFATAQPTDEQVAQLVGIIDRGPTMVLEHGNVWEAVDLLRNAK